MKYVQVICIAIQCMKAYIACQAINAEILDRINAGETTAYRGKAFDKISHDLETYLTNEAIKEEV